MEQRASLPGSVDDVHGVLAWVSSIAPTDTAFQIRVSTEILTLTRRVYLPVVRRQVSPLPPRPLGDVTLDSEPTECDGETCYDIQVDCPQLAESRRATLKVGDPEGSHQGTIVLASGWTGTYYWQGDPEWNPNRRMILDELQAAGFRTVQIKWHANWWDGASGALEGHAKLACRPATVMRWVYDRFHESTEIPFCAAGHSNGASQVGYAITQYGLGDVLTAVLLESGPNFARIDHGCIRHPSDPELQALFWETGRDTINWSLGLPGDSGACVDQEESFRDEFEEASLAYDWGWQYHYPDTMLAFVFGEEDLSTTVVHGVYYYNRVQQAGSPLVSMTVVTGTAHWVAETEHGMATIRDTLMNECAMH